MKNTAVARLPSKALKIDPVRSKRLSIAKPPADPGKPTDRRFTPARVLDMIVEALGEVYFDPCTEPHNPTRATLFLTYKEDGLTTKWPKRGLVYVNPPFSKIRKWAKRVAKYARRGYEIVMLTPVDPSTQWYTTLAEVAQLAAGLKKRVRFDYPLDVKQPKSSAKGPCMLWYFGPRPEAFAKVMRKHAHLFVPNQFPAEPV